MTGHTLAAVGLAAILTTGCTTPGTHTPAGTPPAIGQIDLEQLPDVPHHDGPRPMAFAQPDAAEPEQVAISQLVDGLAAQGLDVVDVGSTTTGAGPDHRTLRVAVTHQSARSAPHTSVYELELTRDDAGTWTVVSWTAVQ